MTAVVVDVALARVLPRRDLGDLRLHHLACGLEQGLLVQFETGPAILLEQFEHAPLAHGAGAHFGLHVVLNDVQSHIGEDQAPHVLAQLAALHHLHRRNPQRLLPDLHGVRVVAAGDVAADVGLMPLDRRPGDQFAIQKDRLEGRHIVVLIAQAEHVVVKDHIARIELIAKKLLDVLAHRCQRERKNRQILGLLQHIAIGVIEAGDVVLGLAQNRRARGLRHRDAHLVGDRLEGAGIDRQQNGIDLAHTPSSSFMHDATRSSRPFLYRAKEPSASTTQSNEALTKMAVVSCSISAGPCTRLP